MSNATKEIIAKLSQLCSPQTLIHAIYELGYHYCTRRAHFFLKEYDYIYHLKHVKVHQH